MKSEDATKTGSGAGEWTGQKKAELLEYIIAVGLANSTAEEFTAQASDDRLAFSVPLTDNSSGSTRSRCTT